MLSSEGLERLPRILLSSGQRWVVLRWGEKAHVLAVEHHWKPGPEIGRSVFDWDAPMSPLTFCGESTKGGEFCITKMSTYESEACAECWRLMGGTRSE